MQERVCVSDLKRGLVHRMNVCGTLRITLLLWTKEPFYYIVAAVQVSLYVPVISISGNRTHPSAAYSNTLNLT